MIVLICMVEEDGLAENTMLTLLHRQGLIAKHSITQYSLLSIGFNTAVTT